MAQRMACWMLRRSANLNQPLESGQCRNVARTECASPTSTNIVYNPRTSSALQGLATRSLFVVFVVHRRWRRSNSRLLELLLLRIRGGVQRLLLDRRLGDRRPLGLIRFYQVYAR